MPYTGRYIGVDYGIKRVGLSFSDEGGTFAFPYKEVPNDSALLKTIAALAKEKNATMCVVGDTKSSGGHDNTISADLQKFVHKLEQAGFTVFLQNELWSSIEASRYAPEGAQKNDAAAAAIILQRFLDTHQKQE